MLVQFVSNGLLGSRASWADGLLGGSTCRKTFLPRVRAGPASHVLEVSKDYVGRIPSSRSHDASSRMGPTPTEVQALHWASVVRVLGHWTGKVELVQGHGTVEYVPSRKPEDSL